MTPPTSNRPPEADALPATIGRFRVLRELGRGATGRVFAAEDPELQRIVALKVFDTDAARRFLPEARVASQLEHPGIVPVHEVGQGDDGRPFLVMRCVDGISLREALVGLARGAPIARWTRRRLLTAFAQVCEAVGFAHERGVVHRDLKPENILLGSFGEVQVVDWGLASRANLHASSDTSNEQHTLEGTIVGTPGYLSPEQADGQLGSLGPASDVFSLGAVLYEIVCGRRAFDGPDAVARTRAVLQRHAPPLPGLDPVLEEICRRALAWAPADRFATADGLGSALRAWDDGQAGRERADHLVAQGRGLLERHREVLADRERIRAAVFQLEAEVRPSEPLDAPTKRALHRALDDLERLHVEETEVFAALLAAGEGALTLDPRNVEARALLADAYADRLRDSDARGDAHESALLARRVEAYDDGRFATLVRGTGAVTLHTLPERALVLAQAVEQRGVVWSLGPPRPLGRTPLDQVPLPQGSWVLTLRAPGARDVRYPVHLGRGEHWKANVAVPLLPDAAIGERWVYVAAGPFLCGGDERTNAPRPRHRRSLPGFLAAVLPVTVAAWCAWLDTLEPEDAWRRAPRHGAGTPLWERPAPGRPIRPPEQDREGDAWDPRWPICGISWDDARAFAAWAGARLPTDDEWEKLARGVDGRLFPWGDRYDASLCANLDSHEGKARPVPVGAYPTDVSVYGARDVAGSMRTWCADERFQGSADLRPVRGGAYNGGPQLGRCANRYGLEPHVGRTFLGLRLVRDLPPDPGG